ncbi:hypothetical protein [Cognatiluteimonas profundi]|uniref:hypothetical protein n=1 Tax=Cognatiluteimonas profundi TaxID=2594501 RepID=UPI00131C3C03|nr:hypothetical protein [Lysobacter profundi]
MTAPTLPQATGASAALTAVLRETGPRALVFAELLCGEGRQADAAMSAAVQALGRDLVRAPVANWTQHFWTLLVAAPPLRRRQPNRQWPSELRALAPMSAGLRATVLLRAVARLDEAEAAAVLGIPLSLQRRALRRALPRDAHGRVDAAAWRDLLAACERAVRAGTDPRSGRLDRLFAMAARPEPTPAGLRPAWFAPALWLACGVCVLALAGAWLIHRAGAGDDPSVRAMALPAASDPASTFDAGTAVLTHPDFDALADAREQALVESLDFYAWYAARMAGAPEAAPLVFPDAAAPAPGTAGNVEAPGASR